MSTVSAAVTEAPARAVRERPILFSGPMVRAILEGRKTETRRIVRTGSYPHAGIAWWEPAVEPGNEGRWSAKDGLGGIFHIPCPYGQPGDLLWARETWAEFYASSRGDRHEAGVCYAADGGVRRDGQHAWRPSIHMPRWASRLTLRVLDVRVERLQEITAKGVCAEGIELIDMPRAPIASAFGTLGRFARAWDAINGKRAAWESNPWVWVIRFEVAAEARPCS